MLRSLLEMTIPIHLKVDFFLRNGKTNFFEQKLENIREKKTILQQNIVRNIRVNKTKNYGKY